VKTYTDPELDSAGNVIKKYTSKKTGNQEQEESKGDDEEDLDDEE
jgi:hypothetical protein